MQLGVIFYRRAFYIYCIIIVVGFVCFADVAMEMDSVTRTTIAIVTLDGDHHFVMFLETEVCDRHISYLATYQSKEGTSDFSNQNRSKKLLP